jgi:hypothetical protein
MTGWMDGVTGGEESLCRRSGTRVFDKQRGNRSGEWEDMFARRLTVERTGGDGMQTSKSRFVYCLGPYIAAMISKGKRGAAGMALVLLLRRVRLEGEGRGGWRFWREHGEVASGQGCCARM